MASKRGSQELPKRDQQTFKAVMKCYEQKQYKKGLKQAESILKKHPQNGETLAMKGLILNCLDRKDEAGKFAQMGLIKNMKSHICWHVYGLIHRSERRYPDAIKAYQRALLFDKENLLILKDLSLLQIQMRQHQGFQETRRKILVLKSDNRVNWIAYAIGNHLCKNYKKCLNILDSYIKTMDANKKWDYGVSEMFLYRNMVIEESGDKKAALADLTKIDSDGRDKQYMWYRSALIQLDLGNKPAAEKLFRKLLEVNAENRDYHEGLRVSLGLPRLGGTAPSPDDSVSEDDAQKLNTLYDEMRAKWKYNTYCKRFPLRYCQGDEFKQRLDTYMRRKLRKGVPSLFRDVNSLYGDAAKAKIIESLATQYYTNIKAEKRFSESDEPNSETPDVLVWVIFFLASHYEEQGEPQRALELLEEGLQHTPTAIDLYVLKARVLKHVRDFEQAYQVLNEAREMDLADRYLNTKCVRYAFRAGRDKDAERIVQLFLREQDTLDHLFDMQVMWYELSAADFYLASGNYAQALTKLYSVDKHFEDIFEDQFDFHTYCLRKITLRAYVSMMRYQDSIRGHRFFVRAADRMIRTHLELFDQPTLARNSKSDDQGLSEEDLSKMTAKERRAYKKKLKRKKKQEEAKKKAEDGKKDGAESNGKNSASSVSKEIPDGKALAESKDQLSLASKVVRQLLAFAGDRLESQIAAAEVYSRKNKQLKVLRALRLARRAAPDDPRVHFASVRFVQQISTGTGLNATVVKIASSEAKKMGLPSSEGLVKFNQDYAKKNNALPCRVAAARAAALLGSDAKSAAAVLYPGTGGLAEAKLTELTVANCADALKFVKSLESKGLSAGTISAFRAACAAQCPLTPEFRDAPAADAQSDAQ